MKEKSLKEQNRINLVLFIAWNVIVLILSLSASLYTDSIKNIATEILSEEGLFMIFSPIIFIVFNGLLSSRLKAAVVFWKWKYSLPGHRIFTKLIHTDHRIDINRLEQNYGKIPIDPIEQNNLWYSILQKQKHDIIVKDSHKAYLLTRDMTAISFVFLASIPVILISDVGMKVKVLSAIYFISQYLITMMVTRNYANRFTCNVLAIDSQGSQ